MNTYPPEQVVLGEILGLLGHYLGGRGGPGGEFIYSNPGYLALIDAAAHVGGIGVPVPLNEHYENDLSALSAKINARTRAIYLVNPHNPSGTVRDDVEFKRFLRASSEHAVVIVDEAYLEYTPDFTTRSAVSLVRDGANVMVFRTFDKIHGLAGLPIGYVLMPKELPEALRKQGAGDAEALGRLNIVAASTALRDTAQVEHTRTAIAHERVRWLSILRQLKLVHTETRANFVYFDMGRPQPEFAAAMRLRGIDIGRAYPQWGSVDFENRCLRWGKDKTASGTGRIVPLNQRAMAALGFWATHFPDRKPEHYVFPSERYGAAGDKFSPKAYDSDPTKPIGSIKEAWERAKTRAGKILKDNSNDKSPDGKIRPLPCRFHDLRHTAVSRMLNGGVPIAKVARSLDGVPRQWFEWLPATDTSRLTNCGEQWKRSVAPNLEWGPW
jgi:histidinol-phosphate/aromatic aminotransferase/cobyric acid decarboxylase-like protein